MTDMFDKELGKQPQSKYSIALHKSPSELSANEGAVYLMMAGVLADAEKLGVDPTMIHLTLEFKATNHVMCLNLSKGGGAVAFTPHRN
jgi:hypothetical protein